MEMDAYRTVLFLCKENKTVRCRKMDKMETDAYKWPH